MGDKRGSSRIKEIGKKQVVDVKTREKRHKRQLEALENDNFHNDPHEQLNLYVAKAKLPSFNEDNDKNRKRKRAKHGEIFKQKAKRSFQALLEELQGEKKEGVNVPTYMTAAVAPSVLPPRHLCSVCGFLSKYTCTTCGSRYCCGNCLKTHKDTRCMKYTA